MCVCLLHSFPWFVFYKDGGDGIERGPGITVVVVVVLYGIRKHKYVNLRNRSEMMAYPPLFFLLPAAPFSLNGNEILAVEKKEGDRFFSIPNGRTSPATIFSIDNNTDTQYGWSWSLCLYLGPQKVEHNFPATGRLSIQATSLKGC